MKKIKEKHMAKFLEYLQVLEPVETLGVARLLGVDLSLRKEGTDPIELPGASIQEEDYYLFLSEMIDKFVQTTEEKRKFLLKIMKAAIE